MSAYDQSRARVGQSKYPRAFEMMCVITKRNGQDSNKTVVEGRTVESRWNLAVGWRRRLVRRSALSAERLACSATGVRANFSMTLRKLFAPN